MAHNEIQITSTSVKISGLRIYARHGVLPQEKTVGNEYVIDCELFYDARQAMESDVIDHALNYASAVEVIKAEMKESSDLLEHVAGRIARALDSSFEALDSGCLTLTKLKPPFPGQLDGVSFTMQWRRRNA